MKEIREHKGYTDIEGGFHTSKEDALLTSIEILLEGMVGERLEINSKVLKEHRVDLMSLLQQYFEEVSSGD